MRIGPFFASLMLAVFVSGCGTPPERRLDSPALRVTSLSGVNGGHVVTIRILNPNATPLVISQSTHTVFCGTERIARFDDPQPIGVPSLGSVDHAFALPPKASAGLSAWLAQHPGDVPVAVETSFQVVVGSDNDTITLKSSGRGLVKTPQP